MLTAPALALTAYPIGSVSGSLVLGRFRHVDIRRHGSGDAGGTHALRVPGAALAAGGGVIDVGKTARAVWRAGLRAPPRDRS